MALRGRKPVPTEVKKAKGNPGKRPIDDKSPPKMRRGPLAPPNELTKEQKALWARFVDTAWWLTDSDSTAAYVWVCLQAEFQQAPGEMTAARIANLRSAASEIGLGPSARARLAVGNPEDDDPADEFFH